MQTIAIETEFNDYIKLVPLFDAHIDSNSSDLEGFRRTVRYVRDTEDAYIIIGGDLTDLILRHDLKRSRGKDLRKELRDYVDMQLNATARFATNELKEIKHKILGYMIGNHEDEVLKRHSFDISKDICERLDIPFLGYSFLYRWTLKKKTSGVKRNVVILGHHGWGGGRRGGASINKLEDMASMYNADIVMSGHDHRTVAEKIIRLEISNSGTPKLLQKEILLVRCGTYLKTYKEGEMTYGEKGGYPPVVVGSPIIEIGFKGHDKTLYKKVTF